MLPANQPLAISQNIYEAKSYVDILQTSFFPKVTITITTCNCSFDHYNTAQRR